MKKIFITSLLLCSAIYAQLNVVTSYPYLGEITKAVGGKNVKVKVLASAKFDPHFIVPKPSLVPAVAKADLLVANGAGLEIGWLPPLIRSAHNPKVNIGASGFLDASRAIRLIDKPKAVSRAYGDIHPEGNPHFAMDPHNLIPIAKLIDAKLARLDPANKAIYHRNLTSFVQQWRTFLKQFDGQMRSCRGMKVVQYHALYNYLLKRYGISAMATLEPLPGIAPSSRHTLEVINTIQKNHISKILQDPYHETKTSRFIAKKTQAKVVVIPQDVGAVSGTKTLKSFYRTVSSRLCQ